MQWTTSPRWCDEAPTLFDVDGKNAKRDDIYVIVENGSVDAEPVAVRPRCRPGLPTGTIPLRWARW
jgi:hypothetical protein